MFTEKFREFADVGDSIDCEVGEFTFRARIHLDDISRPTDYDGSGMCFDIDDSVNHERNSKIIGAWFNGEWFYCGIVVEVIHTESEIELCQNAAAVWAVECNIPGGDNKFLMDTANELLGEAVEFAKESHEYFLRKGVNNVY